MKLRRSVSTPHLAEGADQTTEDSSNELNITFTFPSKFFPAAGLITAISTLGICVGLNRYYGHDIGGINWPYLSDTGKYPPETALFGFGLTLTSILIVVTVTLNYGKVKRDIGRRSKNSEMARKGSKRNNLSLCLGIISAPFLGLLAVFDTARTPELHLLFVLGFFPFMVAYVIVNTSVYTIMAKYNLQTSPRDHPSSINLQTSVKFKKWCRNLLLVFVTLYLPVGLCLVTDWYNYQNDVAVHTFRAVCQHLSVLFLLLYFGTFWYDFGTLRMAVVQRED